LSFWQRFDLPADSLGQVQVSSDEGLSWQPVLTLTTPITTWSPITVNLSAYTGQQIWLAFALISATFEVDEPGLYILHIWAREDGLKLDRLVLTVDSGYEPLGFGPP
jgi:hypothetical protein